ncbi:MAG: hypothetical protein ISS23_01220 [Nanoarchaeota archaeon]|nr:hypothetical protein [Nanoarchaeota archaeon]
MNDIKFIRDDVQGKKNEQLQEILDVLKTKPNDIDVEAASRFFYYMLRAAHKIAEKKKEEEEKKDKIQEIEQKKPPVLKGIELKPSTMHKVWRETTHPITKPKQTPLPEIPTLKEMKLPEIKEFKKVKEEKVEDIIDSISNDYPLILFKNTKNETIAQINIIQQKGKLVYELTEPEIDLRLVEETKKLIQKKFEKDKKTIKDEKFLTKNIKKSFKKLKIDYTEEYRDEIKYFLLKDLSGLGKIDSFIHDPNIKTIICDGLNKPIKITLGPGLEITTNITYTKKEEIDEQIKHLGLKVKQEVSENNPIIEGRFYHFKIQATLGLGDAESKFMIKRMP